jgi:uncharacterized membrane protein YccC
VSVSPEQARLLVAMGLEPMRLRSADETLRRQAPAPPAEAQPDQVARGRPDAGAQGARTAAAPRFAPPATRPGLLLEALRRAAGGRDIGELVADLERLRREPALKRALWPRLRALRRH